MVAQTSSPTVESRSGRGGGSCSTVQRGGASAAAPVSPRAPRPTASAASVRSTTAKTTTAMPAPMSAPWIAAPTAGASESTR